MAGAVRPPHPPLHYYAPYDLRFVFEHALLATHGRQGKHNAHNNARQEHSFQSWAQKIINCHEENVKKVLFRALLLHKPDNDYPQNDTNEKRTHVVSIGQNGIHDGFSSPMAFTLAYRTDVPFPEVSRVHRQSNGGHNLCHTSTPLRAGKLPLRTTLNTNY